MPPDGYQGNGILLKIPKLVNPWIFLNRKVHLEVTIPLKTPLHIPHYTVLLATHLSSYLFFEQALRIAKNACVIHFFDFLKDDEIEKRMVYLKKIAKANSVDLEEIVIEKIKSYSPREFYIRIDITVKKV